MYSRTEYDIYLKTDRGFIKPQKFDGIVWLEENEVFVIVLVNNSILKTKADIYISGHNIATLVLRPLRSSVLTMPIVGPYRRFRYSEFSTCDDCGAKVDKSNNHKLQLLFNLMIYIQTPFLILLIYTYLSVILKML